jgi:hypothetical protein
MNLAAGAIAKNAQVLNPKASGGPSPSQKVSSRGSGMTGNGPTPRDRAPLSPRRATRIWQKYGWLKLLAADHRTE